MKKLMIVMVCALATVGLVVAQETSTDVSEMPPETSAPTVNPKGAAKIIQDDLKEKHGWTPGVNENANGQFILTIGVGAIQAPKGHKAYNQSRVNAFDKAMLDAKAKMAKFLEQEIAAAVMPASQ